MLYLYFLDIYDYERRSVNQMAKKTVQVPEKEDCMSQHNFSRTFFAKKQTFLTFYYLRILFR
jgi:3-dehydroquinate dehydratase